MLGRQQIAGIPTAVSELFKNSFDAYADNAVADLVRRGSIFVLRDDGLGMTKREFEERWLVIGTESKVLDAQTIDRPPIDPEKPLRPVLGEKGIGRLAIAAMGPQVLILMRAKNPPRSPLVAAFINWTMFECVGINLDEIDIPIREFPPGELPSRDDVTGMVGVMRANVERVRKTIGNRASEIRHQLDQFSIDPVRIDQLLGSPSLTDGGHGVHFVIAPFDTALVAGVDERVPGIGSSALVRTLIGFGNTMTGAASQLPLRTHFNDHRVTGEPADLLSAEDFWSEADFALADHYFHGAFDAYGQFQGEAVVYGQRAGDGYSVSWPGARGAETACGPFSLTLGYVQGTSRDSRLAREDWVQMDAKLQRLGGLYIYRDGVRILPYGTAEADFLGMEEKRSKGAAFYFFSYRRLFGCVELTHQANSELQEKAGREGFRDNIAYRHFKAVLEHFFEQVSADFFRDDSPQGHLFVEQRAELRRVEDLRRKRETQVRAKRARFRTDIARAFAGVDGRSVASRAQDILASFHDALKLAAAQADPDKSAVLVLAAEATARSDLADAAATVHVARPRGVSLNQSLFQEWQTLLLAEQGVQADTVAPTLAEIDQLSAAAAIAYQGEVARRLRFDRMIDEAVRSARRIAREQADEARGVATTAGARVAAAARTAMLEVEDVATSVLADASRTDLNALDDDAVTARRRALEQELDNVSATSLQPVRDLRERLEDILRVADGEVAASEELMTAVEDELLALREQSEQDLDLVQLGMALEVVSHEFDAAIRSIRGNLRSLKRWSDSNVALQPIYASIRTAFEHLDGYLRLFTPLQRRLYRTEIEITGKQIFDFNRNLFSDRLRRDEVQLTATPQFLAWSFSGFPSTFFPVFVNLIDNAIYWLQQRRADREITLHAEAGGMTVHDNGPGVSSRDVLRIFEAGFSRKPSGRGLGLYITRDVLHRVGWEIDLQPDDPPGATFRLTPRPDDSQ
jgi:signal transduction histidine kinase